MTMEIHWAPCCLLQCNHIKLHNFNRIWTIHSKNKQALQKLLKWFFWLFCCFQVRSSEGTSSVRCIRHRTILHFWPIIRSSADRVTWFHCKVLTLSRVHTVNKNRRCTTTMVKWIRLKIKFQLILIRSVVWPRWFKLWTVERITFISNHSTTCRQRQPNHRSANTKVIIDHFYFEHCLICVNLFQHAF